MVPLSIILLPFAIFAAIALVYGFLMSLALYRFGGDLTAFAATFLFWAASASILFFTWVALLGVNWNQPLLEFAAFTAPNF